MSNLVSIVIPHWNHRDVLADCLNSLIKTQYEPIEIIVVDNNSTDDSVEFVRKNFAQVTVIENSENLGFAGGCNVGVENARGEFIAILNNDTTQEPDWLSLLMKFMNEHPWVGIVQPKLINATDTSQFDYSGAAGGFMDKFGFPFARGRIYEVVESDDGQYQDNIPIFWASGTACLLRREVYEEVGLFDETFFAHMEEIDFDWRAQLAGWDIYAVPEAVVYHHSGYTLPAESPFKKYLNHRNSVCMLLANYRAYYTVIRGMQRFLLDIAAAFFTLFRGEADRTRAIFKAWGWIFTHPGSILRKRRKVGSVRKLSDKAINKKLYHASIAIEHYIGASKTWERKRHAIEAFRGKQQS